MDSVNFLVDWEVRAPGVGEGHGLLGVLALLHVLLLQQLEDDLELLVCLDHPLDLEYVVVDLAGNLGIQLLDRDQLL